MNGPIEVHCVQTKHEANANANAHCEWALSINVYFCVVSAYRDTIFLAALSSFASSGDVKFDREVINPWGHYDPSTGPYIVPYDGIYQFHVQLQNGVSTLEV